MVYNTKKEKPIYAKIFRNNVCVKIYKIGMPETKAVFGNMLNTY